MFKDRKEAGVKLGEFLAQKYGSRDVVVFGLPRGGVVTAREVADCLRAPLDVLIVRKIGHPFNPEYAFGAIAEGGETVTSTRPGEEVPVQWFQEEKHHQMELIKERVEKLGPLTRHHDLEGKTAILVDDGLATGLTMEAAIKSIKRRKPESVVVAVPVAPTSTIDRIKRFADDVVVTYAPTFFFAVSQFYEEFEEVTDEDVVNLLTEGART